MFNPLLAITTNNHLVLVYEDERVVEIETDCPQLYHARKLYHLPNSYVYSTFTGSCILIDADNKHKRKICNKGCLELLTNPLYPDFFFTYEPEKVLKQVFTHTDIEIKFAGRVDHANWKSYVLVYSIQQQYICTLNTNTMQVLHYIEQPCIRHLSLDTCARSLFVVSTPNQDETTLSLLKHAPTFQHHTTSITIDRLTLPFQHHPCFDGLRERCYMTSPHSTIFEIGLRHPFQTAEMHVPNTPIQFQAISHDGTIVFALTHLGQIVAFQTEDENKSYSLYTLHGYSFRRIVTM